MLKVVVLGGGNSSERPISLKSAKAVAGYLSAKGHKVSLVDPIGEIERYTKQLQTADVVFPALHGAGGEDGQVQAYLESLDIPFVGSGSVSSRLCFDKYKYLTLLQKNHILVPQTNLVTKQQFFASALKHAPFVLKPNQQGSSIGTLIVKKPKDYDEAHVNELFGSYGSMLLEPYISGQEITVGVVAKAALPVIEIVPPANQAFDYVNKYNGKTKEICPPENLAASIETQVKQLAVQIHNLCGCRHLSRTDMIVDGQSIYVLETNTMPGLTDQSLLPKAAQADGIDMVELCSMLVNMALNLG